MTTAERSALLDVAGLSLRVPGRTLIDDAAFTVVPGQLWCVIGANGAGKTLLLHTLAGLRRIDAGSISLRGRPLRAWTLADAACVRGFLPQATYQAFPMPVIDAVLMGRHPHLSRWDWEQDADRERAHAALAEVGLADFSARDMTTLSGGERQRVAVAALLVQEVPLMLLDEPVAHLDLHQQILVLQHLARLAAAGSTVLLSIHDLNLARRFATHALLFDREAKVATGPVDEVMTAAALSRAFACTVTRVAAGERALFVAD